jgi:hypothetical protein
MAIASRALFRGQAIIAVKRKLFLDVLTIHNDFEIRISKFELLVEWFADPGCFPAKATPTGNLDVQLSQSERYALLLATFSNSLRSC